MNDQKKLGLVLGAGASRGFAHVGVLQVLDEAGIDIYCLTGCSMGALVGGLYVTGADLHYLEKYTIKFDMKRYLDLSIKGGGIVRGEKIERLIQILTKNASIENTKIPFACVAVDVCECSIKTFTQGSLYKAIRSSISMPGIFAPYKYGPHYYIDGGVFERLPIQAAKDLGADVVVAVDVSYRGQKYDAPPTNMISTLQRTLSLTGWKFTEQTEKLADLVITPDVREIDPFSSKEAELAIRRGKEAAESSLPDILKLLNKN